MIEAERLHHGGIPERALTKEACLGPRPLSEGGEGPKNTSLEVLIRQLGGSSQQADLISSEDDGTLLINQALSNPETAAIAQELIIKLTLNQDGGGQT